MPIPSIAPTGLASEVSHSPTNPQIAQEINMSKQEFFNAASLAAWAKSLQEELGYTQAQIAQEITILRGKVCDASQVSRALKGEPDRVSVLLPWIEARAAVRFEQDRGKPAKYLRLLIDEQQ